MNFQRSANIKKGFAIVLVGAVVLFVLFVLVRNDFAVDINDLGGAVKKALGTRTVAEQQKSILVQLEITPGDVFKQRLKSGKIVTAVVGTIQNKSKYPMEKVMIEGRLLDGTKKVVITTAPVPCGKTASKKEIRQLGKKKLDAFYTDGDQPLNCIIKSGFSVPFVVFFQSLPHNFNSTFNFEVHPNSGQFLE